MNQPVNFRNGKDEIVTTQLARWQEEICACLSKTKRIKSVLQIGMSMSPFKKRPDSPNNRICIYDKSRSAYLRHNFRIAVVFHRQLDKFPRLFISRLYK